MHHKTSRDSQEVCHQMVNSWLHREACHKMVHSSWHNRGICRRMVSSSWHQEACHLTKHSKWHNREVCRRMANSSEACHLTKHSKWYNRGIYHQMDINRGKVWQCHKISISSSACKCLLHFHKYPPHFQKCHRHFHRCRRTKCRCPILLRKTISCNRKHYNPIISRTVTMKFRVRSRNN
jgi:hypothetical protein